MQKSSLIHLFIVENKVDFGVTGPKRLQPYLTMYIVTFSFPDTMSTQKINSIHLFILEIQ